MKLRRGSRGTRWAAPLVTCLSGVALILAGCGERAGDGPAAKAAARPPAVPVTVSDVVARDVPVQIRAIGNVQAYATVSVLSLVGGELFKIHFTEGQDVKSGDLLFTIDPRPFQAALLQAEAQLAQHKAQIAQAEANLTRDTAQYENARVEEERYKKLADGGFVAREQYDQIRTNEQSLAATMDADRAAITTARAVVQADQAMVENARLQLSYTEIRAPGDGRTGNVLIHQGNVIKANDVGNPLVVITRIHPIYVTFGVPEQYLDRIKQYRAAGELRVEATTQAPSERTSRGDLSFVNNTVDATTGTIQLKATFENTDNALWPGQFVTVVLTLTTERGALVIPSRAIQPGQQGPYVFVVKPDLTVENRPVVVAFADGLNSVIAKGLAAGERIVTDGQLRLIPGARVEIKTSGAPSQESASG
ncbi:MAG TPA: efflux RND transporter periplasmic adaptor subunit [Candidatus Methylomirabilis sp.]|nr:efflux RND transporter periplasmic adaptor subunit [Candidatus Methylomirabilis sp.]